MYYRAATTTNKTEKEYKISDVIKKGSELIAPQISKMKPNNIISSQTKK